MVLRSIRLTALVGLFLAVAVPTNAQLDHWFKKSTIRIDDLSEVPGMVLEPGTYVLKTEEVSNSPRATIELLNQDESQRLTSFTAIPDHRQRPESDVVITYFDGITVGPRPIQTWFYLGDMNGYEFVYPKARAKEIAKYTEDHVLGAESKDAAIVAITHTGVQVPIYDAVSKSGKTHSTEAESVTREKPQVPVKKTPRSRQQKL